MTMRKYVYTIAAMTCGGALPLIAQRPAQDSIPVPAGVIPPGMMNGLLSRGGGIALDFSEVDIRAVLTAIAQAGGIDFTYNDLPAKKISLHTHLLPGREPAMALLRRIVRTNGLFFTERGGLVLITPTPPFSDDVTYAVADTQLFVYRLKHANATRLADVLQSIFGGTARPAGSTGITRPTLSQSLAQSGQGQMGLGGGNGGGGGGFGGGLAGLFNNGGNQNSGQRTGAGGARTSQNGITIVPEESTNSLLIRTDSANWAVVKQAIEAVDIRPLQVMIEVMIAEVQRNDDLNIGISGSASRTRGKDAGTATLPGDTTTGRNFIFDFTHTGAVDVNLAIAALKSRGDVRVLSLPLVFAENNTESHLLVGSQQPFIQSFTTSPTVSDQQNQIVQYRDVGTSLGILPTINPDGYVNLQVQQEVSQATTQIQFGAPVISTREATASLFVRDGQTVVVGGLTDNQEQRTRTGIPVLSDIPWIGGLFGSTQKTNLRTELFLFLTPHIVKTDDDIDLIKKAIGEKAKLLHGVQTGPYIVPGHTLVPGDTSAMHPSTATPVAPPVVPPVTAPVQTIPLPKAPTQPVP